MVKLIVLLLVFFFSTSSLGQTVEDLEKGIRHIAMGVPELDIGSNFKNVVIKKEGRARELAEAIHLACEKHGADPWLMVAIAFRENSFGHGVGSLGEESVFQIMPSTARSIKKTVPECTLETDIGAAHCAASLLSTLESKCGDTRRAIAVYARGKGCKTPVTKKVQWIIWDRQRIAKHLRERPWLKSTK